MRTCLTVAVLLAAANVSPAPAQIPDAFSNLQVLPEDISKGELIAEMRHIAGALGARCHTCHVGEPGASLEGYDFASDEKALKQTAREMMKMVREINGELLPRIGKDRAELIEVRCVTCHHGLNRPQTLDDTLLETLASDGVDAAIDRYRELREQYYGRAAYDFSEWRLIRVAERLAGEDKAGAARRFLELNVEFYPESGKSYYDLGQLDQGAGDKEGALANYRKAAELSPDFAPRIQRIIDQLTAQ